GDFSFGWQVEFVGAPESGWQAQIIAGEGQAEAYLVVFQNRALTEITAGENKGKQLLNRNIVVGFEPFGEVASGRSLNVGALAAEHGCAIILQRPGQGAALGAWRCPAA
ncbi:MAG: hypothetical protein OXC81_05275, partial [Betaproteobacteria bacterium]|nr:hypothetical protein [Betaproteobacteria bacterium]